LYWYPILLLSHFFSQVSLVKVGSKRLDYFDWCQGVELVAKGNHKTTQALASMKEFKAGMNNNRSFFTWEHLVVFYEP
jgi:hypothetical protein